MGRTVAGNARTGNPRDANRDAQPERERPIARFNLAMVSFVVRRRCNGKNPTCVQDRVRRRPIGADERVARGSQQWLSQIHGCSRLPAQAGQNPAYCAAKASNVKALLAFTFEPSKQLLAKGQSLCRHMKNAPLQGRFSRVVP